MLYLLSIKLMLISVYQRHSQHGSNSKERGNIFFPWWLELVSVDDQLWYTLMISTFSCSLATKTAILPVLKFTLILPEQWAELCLWKFAMAKNNKRLYVNTSCIFHVHVYKNFEVYIPKNIIHTHSFSFPFSPDMNESPSNVRPFLRSGFVVCNLPLFHLQFHD